LQDGIAASAWGLLGGDDLVNFFADTGLPEFPIATRDQPTDASNDFGGINSKDNAVNGSYGTYWRSVFSPNDGTPQWHTTDLAAFDGDLGDCWFIWKNPTTPFYQPGSTLGSDGASSFNACPRDYKIRAHPGGAGFPSPADAGWVDLVAVTDNEFSQVIHTGLDLSAYRYVQFYCTASSGVTDATDDVQIRYEVRPTANGTDDSWFAYGDSITMEAFQGRRPDNSAWDAGPLEDLIEAATGRPAPVIIDGGTGGWQFTTGDTNKVAYFGSSPCKHLLICFGSNDANQASIDLNDAGPPSGVDSDLAQARKAALESMIDYANGLGKLVVVPAIPDGSLADWSHANVLILNEIVAEVLAEYDVDTQAAAGPDLYTFFHDNPGQLRDGLHPTYDPGGGGLVGGLTGYGNHHGLWAAWIQGRY